MRKLGKEISQRGHGKNVRKLPSELITELTVKIKKTPEKSIKLRGPVTKKQLAKKLNISERTLNSYKKYFASLENKKIKLGKNDRRPRNEKQFLKKFYKATTELNNKLPKNKRIRKTREAGNKYDISEIEEISPLISKASFKKLKKELDKKETYGFLVRVHVLFITKDGTFDEWLTFIPPIKSSPQLKNYNTLNSFLSQELEDNFKSKNNIYSYRHNVLSFEILEVLIIPTLQLPDKK